MISVNANAVLGSTNPEVWVNAVELGLMLICWLIVLAGLYLAGWVVYELLARPWRKAGFEKQKYNAVLKKLFFG